MEKPRNLPKILQKVVQNTPEWQESELVDFQVNKSANIDGFVSTIEFVTLTLRDSEGQTSSHKVVVKLMKGSPETRAKMQSSVQFPNEIAMYKNVIQSFLTKFRSKFVTIQQDLWCPRLYFAEVSQRHRSVETVLVVEDLAARGYQLGDRLSLPEKELRLMTRAIAELHACSYAMKIQGDPKFEELKKTLQPLHFHFDDRVSLYNVLYEVAFTRLFSYLDANPDELDTEELARGIQALRSHHSDAPTQLMQAFTEQEEPFSVFVHGDFMRNNVLFRYDETGSPSDLRMFDFQQVRYGSPALDLSFYLFVNMSPESLRSDLFPQLLREYHQRLTAALCELLECQETDERLAPYSFEAFSGHLKRFCLYGALVCTNFLPWMTCPPEECERLAQFWFEDMFSRQFKDQAMICGDDASMQRVLEVLRLAARLGFMERLEG